MALALMTGLVSLVFAAFLFQQYRRRARPFLALWSAGLVWYALASLTEFMGALEGWSPTLYQLWYLSGAIGVAAFLGAGVIFLHTPGKFGYVVAAAIAFGAIPALFSGSLVVAVVSLALALVLAYVQLRRPESLASMAVLLLLGGTVFAAMLLVRSPLDLAELPIGDSAVTGKAAPATVRLLTPLFNIPGAAILVGGAIRSAWSSWRQKTQQRRVVVNVCIMMGAFVDSGASSLARLGWPGAFYAGQFVGLLFLFAGFLLSIESSRRPMRALIAMASRLPRHAIGPGA